MWVQLKTPQRLEVYGKTKTYAIGDWVDVGKMTAMLWISEGSAWIPEGMAVDLTKADCGVFIWGNLDAGRERLGDYVGKIDIEAGKWPQLSWSKTLVYNPHQRVRKELVPIGFHLLDTWQAAVPLWDYDELAQNIGTPEDRERTKAIVRDLRVPVYCSDVLFLRRCGDTERLLEQWQAEDEGESDRRLSLLRAIYTVKPLILALPTPWIWKDMQID